MNTIAIVLGLQPLIKPVGTLRTCIVENYRPSKRVFGTRDQTPPSFRADFAMNATAQKSRDNIIAAMKNGYTTQRSIATAAGVSFGTASNHLSAMNIAGEVKVSTELTPYTYHLIRKQSDA